LSLTGCQVAIARLEVEGSRKRGLVLAPHHDGGLLCAAFLTSDIPELPKPPLEQPQQEKELKAGCTHAIDIPFETQEYLQGDNQTNVFVTGPLVQPTLPQQFPSQQRQARVRRPLPQPPARVRRPLPQPQACAQGLLSQPPAYVQGPLSQPPVQQGELSASLDAQHALIGELVSGNGELTTTAENNASVDFHLADSSWETWDVSSFYDRDMSRVGVNVLPGQTAGGTQDGQEIFHQYMHF